MSKDGLLLLVLGVALALLTSQRRGPRITVIPTDEPRLTTLRRIP